MVRDDFLKVEGLTGEDADRMVKLIDELTVVDESVMADLGGEAAGDGSSDEEEE